MKTFEIFESKVTLTERKLYDVAIALCESLERMLEGKYNYQGGIDYEEQPEQEKGVSSDSGFGIQQSKAGQATVDAKEFAEQWNKLKRAYMQMRGSDPKASTKMYDRLVSLAKSAQKNKGMKSLEMPPAPEEERRSF